MAVTDIIAPNRFTALLEGCGEPLARSSLEVLQVNVGRLCNQTCRHCHVNAGPTRKELMSEDVAEACIRFLDAAPTVRSLDLTGGAPEMSPVFRRLALAGRARGLRVIDRCNLTILLEPGYEDLAEFLAGNRIDIIASLPCYHAENVDRQRGDGVFDKSVAALQLLKAMGATAIAAVSTPEKAAFARENGADHVITTNHDDLKQAFRSQIEEITGVSAGRGCDLVIDMVGGDVFEASLRVLKFAGRLIIVGFAGGQIPAAKANYLLFNNLTVMGAPLDTHFRYAYPAMEKGSAERSELYLEGKLKPGATETFPLDEFKAAFARITGRGVMGNIVLVP